MEAAVNESLAAAMRAPWSHRAGTMVSVGLRTGFEVSSIVDGTACDRVFRLLEEDRT
jgi:hypothetical protein